MMPVISTRLLIIFAVILNIAYIAWIHSNGQDFSLGLWPPAQDGNGGQDWLEAGRKKGSGEPCVKSDLAQADEASAQMNATAGRGMTTGGACGMCSAAPELCREIGERGLAQSIAYAGSNDRLWRALAKMQTGEPWVMAVIGGSDKPGTILATPSSTLHLPTNNPVSKGFGIDWGTHLDPPHDPKYRLPNMHRLIFDHLDEMYPAPKSHGGNRSYGASARQDGVNSLINDAQGGTGSGYFSYCFAEHVPQDADLILIELGINDELLFSNFDTYELLVRSLLDLPNKPAVMYIEIFSLLFGTMAMGAETHRGINQFYDIPMISLRNPFLPRVLANTSLVPLMFAGEPESEGSIEGLDLRHLSHEGHRKTAGLVNAYVDTQICAMQAQAQKVSPVGSQVVADPDTGVKKSDVKKSIDEAYPVGDLPRLRVMQQYDTDTHLPKLKPSCQSMASSIHKLTPSKNDGWREWNWQEKKYLIADQPGSTVSFPFTTVLGQVQVQYQRSAEYGFGTVMCWIEGHKDTLHKYVEGYWDVKYNIVQQAAIAGVPPGEHELTCRLLEQTADPGGKHEFRIVSITSV